MGHTILKGDYLIVNGTHETDHTGNSSSLFPNGASKLELFNSIGRSTKLVSFFFLNQ